MSPLRPTSAIGLALAAVAWAACARWSLEAGGGLPQAAALLTVGACCATPDARWTGVAAGHALAHGWVVPLASSAGAGPVLPVAWLVGSATLFAAPPALLAALTPALPASARPAVFAVGLALADIVLCNVGVPTPGTWGWIAASTPGSEALLPWLGRHALLGAWVGAGAALAHAPLWCLLAPALALAPARADVKPPPLRLLALHAGLVEDGPGRTTRQAAAYLSREQQADDALELVVWPEAAVPGPIDLDLAKQDPELLPPRATTWRLFGAHARPWRSRGPVHNVAVLQQPDGRHAASRAKRFLAPAYEPGRVVPATTTSPVLHLDGWEVAVPICSELLDDRFFRGLTADLVVVLASDAFDQAGETTAHLTALTRLRALELGLPVVRVSTGGPLLAFDARGEPLPAPNGVIDLTGGVR
jgi:hypothetical protein